MATHASAEKAARQSLKRRARNAPMLTRSRTVAKKVRLAAAKKYTGVEEAKKILLPLFDEAQSVFMKAATAGVIKARTASRKISRLGELIHRTLKS